VCTFFIRDYIYYTVFQILKKYCTSFFIYIKYADPVCDQIDPYGQLRHRLFRDACVYHQNNFIKDLSRLGRNIDQICIVDNSPVSFFFQSKNAPHLCYPF
ncbi:unnamed protein product, partial [Protopolystoma xenopodis]